MLFLFTNLYTNPINTGKQYLPLIVSTQFLSSVVNWPSPLPQTVSKTVRRGLTYFWRKIINANCGTALIQIFSVSLVLNYINLITLRDVVDGNCECVCDDVERSGNYWPTVWDDLSVTSWRANKIRYLNVKSGSRILDLSDEDRTDWVIRRIGIKIKNIPYLIAQKRAVPKC
jgi:hypothetical protein